jgi:choline-sulfatase
VKIQSLHIAQIMVIMSQPSTLPKSQTQACTTSLIDIGPTLLDLAQVDAMPDVSGRSLAAHLTDKPSDATPHDIFCEYIGLLGDKPTCMIRSGKWKLNYYSEFDSCQLFNLENDPTERDDLALDSAHQQIVYELKEKINARWSALSMLSKRDKQQRARQLIRAAGHTEQPPVEHFVSSAQDNAFDFSQLEAK